MKPKLSPSVIKEAVDNLPVGLAFGDAAGRLVLVNRTMAELGMVLLGSQPQTRQEMEDALAKPGAAVQLEQDPPLFRFPDGRIWRFDTVALEEPAGYTQTTAQEMTRQYHAAARLRQENAALLEASREMKEMYARRADHIRDLEVLEMKMRLHDDIGSALLTLTGLVEKGNLADADGGLKVLKEAVDCFSQAHTRPGQALEEVQAWASGMGVDVQFAGSQPVMPGLVSAAVRECVTNCLRHAGGRKVFVDFSVRDGFDQVVISNDGRPPLETIIEGVGLGSLRRKVELAGGTMDVQSHPAFALRLHLAQGGKT